MKKHIKINERDNVIIALENLSKGDVVESIEIKEDIRRGHKFAIKDIKKGEKILKYGHVIGMAKEDISKGAWVHTHNIKTTLDQEDRVFTYNPKFYDQTQKFEDVKVKVYKRSNGLVGIRNELWVVPTVGCVNGEAKNLVQQFLLRHPDLKIDGAYAITHPYGCSQMGDDKENTKESLQDIVLHPNAGGVLVLGLGCEENQVKEFRATIGEYDESRIKFLEIQSVSDDEKVGLDILEELYSIMSQDKREEVPFSEIRVGLECGGSDGMSGITANPLIGLFSDYIVAQGGTSVLTEVPEMFGAEDVLLNRCDTKETYDKLLFCIDDFKDYYKRNGQVIYENPSPGNKEGGITTLEDKSCGCVEKGGSSKVVDVLKHTERIRKNGLNIISGPGNDIVATTALGMCGCHLVLFSTGRGTPLGSFIPVLKISTNTELYERKRHWIDFNSGEFNSTNKEETLRALIKEIIEVIEGKKTKAEINNIREIAIFKKGVTL
ncbi:MAG: altronate dehydratase family protein [Gammaproteobacteria bacterium]|nr:altronate dehydratase family protein [Gammaproteobacteria bacterium]